MILVTGASGKTGRAVIKALVARGAVVRALVRNAAHEESLKALGAKDVVIGEMDDPAALARAMSLTRSIYHICPNMSPHEITFAKRLVDAATTHGISRFVYHSVLHPQIEAMPHHWNKLRVEEILFASKIDVTILQPTAYMQNCLTEWDRIHEDGVYRVPYPIETRLSLVDLDDVAEAAAMVLTQDKHTGATYELVGTSPLSQIEVANAFGDVLRKQVHAEEETIQAWDQRASTQGVGDYARSTLIRMFLAYARDGLTGNPNVLGWLLGRAPTSLNAFAARIAAQA